MEFWNTFRTQITTLWKQWSLHQRIMISGAAVVCLLTVVGTLFWATRPEYVVIASDLSPQKTFEIMGALENAQIDAKTNFGSTSVSVPRADVGNARVAMRDIWEPIAADESGLMTGFPGSPAEEHDRRVRKLEARIARSIEQFRGVASATVLISRPDPSPFVISHEPPTASVTVEAAGRVRLNNQDGQAIVMLVARAVEGLKPENVILTDTSGNQYSTNSGSAGGGMSAQLEYQRSVELNLAQSAESLLVSMLGEGKAQVRVTADIDFRETSRTETTFDPDVKVKRTENVETISQEGSKALNAGFGGGFAGQDGRRMGEEVTDMAGGGGSYKRESNTTDYDTATTSLTTREAPGTIKRLTVAAIVDLSGATDPNAAGTALDDTASPAAGTPAVTQEQVENIIRQAVGFDELRNDQLAVTIAPLSGIAIEPDIPTVLTFYQEYRPLVESVLVGLAATVAFLIAVLALRKIRPVVVPTDATESFTREDYRRMAALSEKAQSHPDLAAQVIATWMGQAPSSDDADHKKPASQRQQRAA